MGIIYARAQTVLVHLAEEKDNTPEGTVWANGVKSIVEEVSQLINSADGNIANMPVLDSTDLFLKDERWGYLADMLGRPWFTRAWVVQEVGLATDPRVLLGAGVDFSYRDVTQLALWQQRCAPQLPARFDGLDFSTIHIEWLDWRSDPADVAADRTFLELMNQASWLGCADHRDHIYSLLGHPLAQLPEGKGLIVDPDYNKSVEDVYHELTTQLLRLPTGLRVLSAVENYQPPEGAVSWVPMWRETSTTCNLGIFPGFYYDVSRDLGQAEEDINGMLSVRIDGNILHVKGVILDSVDRVYPLQEYGMEYTRPENGTLDRIWDEVVIGSSYNATYPSKEDRIDAFSLSLTAGLSGYDPAEMSPDRLERHRANFVAYSGKLGSSPHNKAEMVGDAETFWTEMRLTSSGRSFVVTKTKQMLGLAPYGTTEGDRVVVLVGARVPFIAREAPHVDKGSKTGTWQLIGECYMHGIMRGEVSTWSAQDRVVQDLLIR
jgi:hypothetical protein